MDENAFDILSGDHVTPLGEVEYILLHIQSLTTFPQSTLQLLLLNDPLQAPPNLANLKYFLQFVVHVKHKTLPRNCAFLFWLLLANQLELVQLLFNFLKNI